MTVVHATLWNPAGGSFLHRLRIPSIRQRLYLLAAGVGWLLYGIQVVLDPFPRTVRSAAILENIASISAWGWMWIVCSSIAILAALIGRQWMIWIGFGAAIYAPLVWGIAFLWAWATGDYPSAWAGAATWLAGAFRLLLVAGWPTAVTVTKNKEVIQ